MGLSTTELDKLMQSGELAANEFLPAFSKALQETFHEGAMKNATKSIANATRQQNEYNKSLKEVGGPLKDVGIELSTIRNEFLIFASDAAFSVTAAFVDLIGYGEEFRKNLDADATEMSNLSDKTTKAATKVEKFSKSIEALNGISLKLEGAQKLDELRDKLGLTEKGFEILKKGFGGGKSLLKLFDDKDEKTQELFFDNVNKILAAQKGGSSQFFKINQKDIEFIKTLDKWMGTEFDPFGGLDPAFAQTLGKVGDFAKADKDKIQPVNLGPTEALEAGSADALRFASRPIEKNMEKIAQDQLTVQGQIKDGIDKIGTNQNPVNTADI